MTHGRILSEDGRYTDCERIIELVNFSSLGHNENILLFGPFLQPRSSITKYSRSHTDKKSSCHPFNTHGHRRHSSTNVQNISSSGMLSFSPTTNKAQLTRHSCKKRTCMHVCASFGTRGPNISCGKSIALHSSMLSLTVPVGVIRSIFIILLRAVTGGFRQ